MSLLSTLLLHIVTLFGALWIGGGLLGLLLLPLVGLGKPGVLIGDVIKGIAIAWIAISIFAWAGRSHTVMMVLLLAGTIWNDARRRAARTAVLKYAAGTPEEGRASEAVEVEGFHIWGDIIGLGLGWYLSGWITGLGA